MSVRSSSRVAGLPLFNTVGLELLGLNPMFYPFLPGRDIQLACLCISLEHDYYADIKIIRINSQLPLPDPVSKKEGFHEEIVSAPADFGKYII